MIDNNIITIHIELYILLLLSEIGNHLSHDIEGFNCSILKIVFSSDQTFEDISSSLVRAVVNDYLDS